MRLDVYQEWVSWRVVCELLRERGIDINDDKHELLAQAIRHHARMFHKLLVAQGAVIDLTDVAHDAKAVEDYITEHEV